MTEYTLLSWRRVVYTRVLADGAVVKIRKAREFILAARTFYIEQHFFEFRASKNMSSVFGIDRRCAVSNR